MSAAKKKYNLLDITCISADCESNLHCYSLTKKMKILGLDGKCRYCGIKLVNWKRTKKCDITDVKYTMNALRTELWRHVYWHIEFDEKALKYANKYGLIKLRDKALQRIKSSISKPANAWDGRQTPRKGNPIYYAQHATATCCRKCIEQWYGIPINISLTDDQINFLVELIMIYLEERLK